MWRHCPKRIERGLRTPVGGYSSKLPAAQILVKDQRLQANCCEDSKDADNNQIFQHCPTALLTMGL